MLWDAARVNENLNVVLISPNAQEIYEERLRFVNREKKDPSRIQGRVVCLPYSFKGIIYQLKNQYVEPLKILLDEEKNIVHEERKGYNVEALEGRWQNLAIRFAEKEFLLKTEYILEKKLNKKWSELKFDVPDYKIELTFKSFLHSLIANDEYVQRWLERFNEIMNFINSDYLHARVTYCGRLSIQVGIHLNCSGKDVSSLIKLFEDFVREKNIKVNMVDLNKRQLIEGNENIQRLEHFIAYLDKIKTSMSLEEYFIFRPELNVNQHLKTMSSKLIEYSQQTQNFPEIDKLSIEMDDLVTANEKREIENIFGGKTFQFSAPKGQP